MFIFQQKDLPQKMWFSEIKKNKFEASLIYEYEYEKTCM